MSAATLALCCECGTVKVVNHHLGEFLHGTHTGLLRPDDPAQDRCVVVRHCQQCRTRRPHAYLLNAQDAQDAQEEELEYRRAAERMFLAQQLEDEIDRLRACEVTVTYVAPSKLIRQGLLGLDVYAQLVQSLMDGHYLLDLNAEAPAWSLTCVLDGVWTALSAKPNALHWFTRSAQPDVPYDIPFRIATFMALRDEAPKWVDVPGRHSGPAGAPT